MAGFCNKSTVKQLAKNKKIRVSEEFYAELDSAIEKEIEKAITRAKANHRTTLLKQDI